MTAAKNHPPEIFGLMSKIMAEAPSIAKGRKNVQQGYQFRGVDDVYLALQPLLSKYGVLSIPTVIAERSEERQGKAGGNLIYRILTIRYDFYAPDGSLLPVTVIGEGMDSGDKASNKAMSVAHKYALLQAFCIPTDEPKDPENESPEVVPREVVKAPDGPYNHQLLEDREELKKKLRDLGIDPNLWLDTANELHGKPKTKEALMSALNKAKLAVAKAKGEKEP